MSLGKSCEQHGIPENVCVACRGAEQERERIIELLNERIAHVEAVAKSMGEPDDVSLWSIYPRAVWLELGRMLEVIVGNLPVKNDLKNGWNE